MRQAGLWRLASVPSLPAAAPRPLRESGPQPAARLRSAALESLVLAWANLPLCPQQLAASSLSLSGQVLVTLSRLLSGQALASWSALASVAQSHCNR